MNLDIIFFIGPQGSGKGTQARLLAERLGFFHWENGAILREKAKEDSPLGRKTKEVMDSGKLLEDDHLFEVVTEKLKFLPENKGIIFDGIPRRLSQAQFLMDYLQSNGHQNFTTVYLSIPREDSVARILKRAQIEGRGDDTTEAIAVRLNDYESTTIPVLDYLKGKTSFVEVDGRPPVAEVTKTIFETLGLTS